MTERRHYRLDSTVQVHATVMIGGSPLKLFRLTEAGTAVVFRIAAGDAVAESALTTALLDAGAIHPGHATPHHTSADVTVVVPTFGAAEHAPVGAIVVDDGSRPPVQGATVRLTTNRGPGAARNRGLELVTTPLVAFVDSDVELDEGWLDPLLAHFVDERVALVAPRVRTRRDDTALGRYEHDHSPLDLGPSRAGHAPAHGSATYPPPRSFAAPKRSGGSAGSIPRSATGRMSISCGVSVTPAGHVATNPTAWSTTPVDPTPCRGSDNGSGMDRRPPPCQCGTGERSPRCASAGGVSPRGLSQRSAGRCSAPPLAPARQSH